MFYALDTTPPGVVGYGISSEGDEMQTIKTSINLDEATAEALGRLAEREERNRSDVMRRLIRCADKEARRAGHDEDEGKQKP